MRVAASLQHPNIVAIHNVGEDEGLLFLVMDFVSGADLGAVIRQSGPIAPARASDLLTQVASGLDAAHARGLVHRDVKPANILIAVRDGEERACRTDFGLARRFDSESSIASFTQTGVVVGTVNYMSPEQITGERVDARTDIYALGCVFFEMLSGKVPYQRENSLATLYAHVHDPPPSLERRLDELYPTFGAVLERAMVKDPRDRYLSARDFARDAAAALHGVRYTGPQTVVASGDARPLDGDPGAAESPAVSGASAERAAARAEPAAGRGEGERGRGGPPARGLRRYLWAAAAALLAVAVIAAVVALSSGGSSPPAAATNSSAVLRAVPANRVTGGGTATVRITGNTATVTVDTNGLIAAPHLMHIHGGTGNCPTASDARLYRGHLVVGAAEGNAVYGAVVTSLTAHGSTSPAVDLVASLYPPAGSIRYKRTVQLGAGVADTIKTGMAVIVVHGIDYDGTGRYDNVLGADPRFGGLAVEESAPALCGPLVAAQTASTGGRPAGAIYTAALRLYGGSPRQPLAPPLLCHVPPGLVNALPVSGEVRVRAA
jgi:hypothetical protein